MGAYLGALALLREVEQGPQSPALDLEVRRRVDRTLALSAASLGRDPRDARAHFARAGAHAVLGRLAYVRGHRREAGRQALRMREEALAVRELDPANKDALLGLGLYDYYADALPGLVKLLRLIMGLPGGDHERGLAELREAKQGSLFHDIEVREQLYEIYAFYERRPDPALEEIRDLRRRYPGSPLWALKLAEHERDRLGLYGDSAAVARQILEVCRQRNPDCTPSDEAKAQVSLGESLLLDLRLADAREVLLAVPERTLEVSWVAPTEQLLLGRTLELMGDRQGAFPHYAAAAESPDREVQRRAKATLKSPLQEREVLATRLLSEARRLREARRDLEAALLYREALRVWPSSDEALMRVAEDDLAHGWLGPAREALERLADREAPHPPWVRPWIWLLLGRLHDLSGRRRAAVNQYRRVWDEPFGQEDLKTRAAQGLSRPYAPEVVGLRGAAAESCAARL